jgi:hypothetical protein
MDTFLASNASNVPTRDKQSKKRGNLQTARTASFGRAIALSRGFPTLKEQQSRAASVGRSEDSSDVALSADVAPVSDSHIDGCDLLQRSVVPYGACKALACGAMDHAVSRGVGISVLASRQSKTRVPPTMTIVFGRTDGSCPTASISSKEPTTYSRMGKPQYSPKSDSRE